MKLTNLRHMVQRTEMDDDVHPVAVDSLRRSFETMPQVFVPAERWGKLQQRIRSYQLSQRQSAWLRARDPIDRQLWFVGPRYSLLLPLM